MSRRRVFSLGLMVSLGAILTGSVSAQSYGGSLTVAAGYMRMGFDPVGHWADSPGGIPSHDVLLQVDVTRGPGGPAYFHSTRLGLRSIA